VSGVPHWGILHLSQMLKLLRQTNPLESGSSNQGFGRAVPGRLLRQCQPPRGRKREKPQNKFDVLFDEESASIPPEFAIRELG